MQILELLIRVNRPLAKLDFGRFCVDRHLFLLAYLCAVNTVFPDIKMTIHFHFWHEAMMHLQLI
jgi:hypothetical protein